MILEALTVLYDADCGFCARCKAWLQQQQSAVHLDFIARDSLEVTRRFPGLEPKIDDELLVIDDHGGVYRGPDAFIMCLYALDDYRDWSLRLSAPGLKHLARVGFELVSSRRHRINEWLGLQSDRQVEHELRRTVGLGAPRCVS
jgi:predicted DCC family thiol-disulfide oxidoreductase YuxK